ncbi:hypothetical protein KIN20_038436 [Parelaphostrongylus tenuis]|uniref:Uncharacterized protein n=1 Tax=Parelaphostrongylus tenuis TaxID=148309 RepID=A0AAD5WD60_PARTN|nr:hypothetical protein KIN20_038436 [Parelaphostrongylus tenuis]
MLLQGAEEMIIRCSSTRAIRLMLYRGPAQFFQFVKGRPGNVRPSVILKNIDTELFQRGFSRCCAQLSELLTVESALRLFVERLSKQHILPIIQYRGHDLSSMHEPK